MIVQLVCKKLIKNSQPFRKKFQKTLVGDFFDSHCILAGIKVTYKFKARA